MNKAIVFFHNAATKDSFLSERETECVYYLIRGHTSKMIAKILSLSPRTVDDYLDRAKTKMMVSSRREIVTKIMANFQ